MRRCRRNVSPFESVLVATNPAPLHTFESSSFLAPSTYSASDFDSDLVLCAIGVVGGGDSVRPPELEFTIFVRARPPRAAFSASAGLLGGLGRLLDCPIAVGIAVVSC